MGLHLHLGSAGSGKTTGIHERILEEAKKDKLRSFLIVVPEQFTLQTQREIIEKSENNGMMNIDVLSFARMSHRVFEEQGLEMLPVLEDTGKSMIVKRVALENRDKLVCYRNKVGNKGFIEEMKSLIAEFYQYGIGADEIDRMLKLSKDKKQLKSKLEDISLLYNAFADFIDGKFCMNEQVTDRLCEVADKSKLLLGSVVAFDGFTGFTPSQYKCIKTLLELSKDIHVVLTIDPRDLDKLTEDKSLFYLSTKTIFKLERLANELGIEVYKHIYQSDKGRFSGNLALGHLEKNIFRYPFSKTLSQGAVKLLSCETKEQEVAYCIAKIRELVFEENYRYQDIAVVTGDINSYAPTFRREFEKAEIPLFVDEKKNIKGTAAVEMLLSALEIVGSDFSYDSVFRFLKSGLTGIDRDDISILENYCLRCGIKGKRRWEREFKLSEKNQDITEELIEKINKTRVEFIDIISPLLEVEGKVKPKAKTQNKSADEAEEKAAFPTVRERLGSLYSVLDKCDIEEKLYYKAEELGKGRLQKERILAKEKSMLFKGIIDVFNRIDALMETDRIPLKEFVEILDTGFNEAKLRNIPGGADSIVLGDIERTRLNNKKIVFFLGVNDNVIPKQTGAGGILSDYDRSLFEENDIELSPTKKENAYLSEFYLYLALTRPSDKLFMSFARTGDDDKEGRPAYIIGRLLKLFMDLKVEDYVNIDRENPYFLLGADKGLSTVTDALRVKKDREPTMGESIILDLFAKENERLVQLLNSASERRSSKNSINAETAEKLYGECIRGSITRLQSFASCAFLHFLKYGLNIKPREEYELSGLEIGNMYHLALEKYGDLLKKEKKSWRDVEGAERDAKEEKAVELALNEYSDLVESTNRNSYFKERLKRVLSRSVDVITDQIKAGGFEVKYLEKSFEHTNRFLNMRGKIDRIDVAEKNGKTYVRVIDYKSGKQSFDLNMLYYGLQLQLAVYLRECGIDATGAGMYYYKIDDPIIESKTLKYDEAVVEAERKKRFVLDGVSSDDASVLELLDSSLAKDGELISGAKSGILGITIKKAKELPKSKKTENLSEEEKKEYQATFDSNSSKKVLSSEKLKYLTEFAAQKTTEMTMQIKTGSADINPYDYNGKRPCEYCEYHGICSFDENRGDEYRVLEKDAAEKYLWEAMQKDTGTGEVKENGN